MMERAELESEFHSLGEASNNMSAMLDDCLNKFYAIEKIADAITEQHEVPNSQELKQEDDQ